MVPVPGGDGAEDSFAPPAGPGAEALRDRVAKGDGDWAKAYQRERESVATTVDDQLPNRYGDLIKQYYETLDSRGE
jgi:hypothetical protein